VSCPLMRADRCACCTGYDDVCTHVQDPGSAERGGMSESDAQWWDDEHKRSEDILMSNMDAEHRALYLETKERAGAKRAARFAAGEERDLKRRVGGVRPCTCKACPVCALSQCRVRSSAWPLRKAPTRRRARRGLACLLSRRQRSGPRVAAAAARRRRLVPQIAADASSCARQPSLKQR
jgi:hypothetical protein